MYKVTKKFGPYSAAFRQHAARSHCRFIHGYGLVVELTFGAEQLDALNWVVDFGGFKPLKAVYEDLFDHKLLVAKDDPYMSEFESLAALGLAHLRIRPAVGCEVFARMAGELALAWMEDADTFQLLSCQVWEHELNSAIWEPDPVPKVKE